MRSLSPMGEPGSKAVRAWTLDAANAYDEPSLPLAFAMRRIEPMALARQFQFTL
jgi:hypothetical protein